MYFYINYFKAMKDNDWLNTENPFQRESFTMVFLPHLQDKVDFYVIIWNRYQMRHINENGRFRGGHVLARYFHEYERLK